MSGFGRMQSGLRVLRVQSSLRGGEDSCQNGAALAVFGFLAVHELVPAPLLTSAARRSAECPQSKPAPDLVPAQRVPVVDVSFATTVERSPMISTLTSNTGDGRSLAELRAGRRGRGLAFCSKLLAKTSAVHSRVLGILCILLHKSSRTYMCSTVQCGMLLMTRTCKSDASTRIIIYVHVSVGVLPLASSECRRLGCCGPAVACCRCRHSGGALERGRLRCGLLAHGRRPFRRRCCGGSLRLRA